MIEIQRRLPNARVLYVSATGATESSNLGYMQRLGLWGKGTAFESRAQFVHLLDQRGVGKPPPSDLAYHATSSPQPEDPAEGSVTVSAILLQSRAEPVTPLEGSMCHADPWCLASPQELQLQDRSTGDGASACITQSYAHLRQAMFGL